MKIKCFISITLITFSVFVLASCNANQEETIRINGEVSTKVEVRNEYIDEGVIYPEKYLLVTNGEVNSDKLGTYEIKYYIFTDGGEVVKQLLDL